MLTQGRLRSSWAFVEAKGKVWEGLASRNSDNPVRAVRVLGSGIRVRALGVQGWGFKAQGFGFRGFGSGAGKVGLFLGEFGFKLGESKFQQSLSDMSGRGGPKRKQKRRSLGLGIRVWG